MFLYVLILLSLTAIFILLKGFIIVEGALVCMLFVKGIKFLDDNVEWYFIYICLFFI